MTPIQPRTLTLCADDFAQSPAISEGILQLIARHRLSATSVMTQSPHWPDVASALKQHSQHVDIGLHFNLTHPFDGSAKPLSYWLLRSQLGMLDQHCLTNQMLAQLDSFTQHLGQLPDFIDGHQHVHALPTVRQALFSAIDQFWGNNSKPYIRSPDVLGDMGDSGFKGTLLTVLCRGFSSAVMQRHLATPGWFGGLYSLTAEADYANLMAGWLKRCPNQALMMCHPGLPHADKDDPIHAARANEFQFLSSDGFTQLCEQHHIRLARFNAKTAY